MKRAIAIVMLLTLAACGADGEPKPPHQRQQPSVTEPGVSVSGYAEFGVVKNF
jgi:predicted small lipoprotein YifL